MCPAHREKGDKPKKTREKQKVGTVNIHHEGEVFRAPLYSTRAGLTTDLDEGYAQAIPRKSAISVFEETREEKKEREKEEKQRMRDARK